VPNTLNITVENATELLNAGAYGPDAIARVQSSATEAGTYADLTGTGSTPTIALVSGTRIHTGYDPAGTSSTWYRTRYENSGATRLSDWSAAFQVGGETAGKLCSIYDAEQRLVQTGSSLNNDERENVIELIDEVSDYITSITGRRFVPDPLSGTKTIRLHTHYGRRLRIPRGIRSITTLGIASSSQPDTGGTYTTATAGTYYIDPPADDRTQGWPGSSIILRANSGAVFYTAEFGAEITGAFGFAAVPPAISHIALNLVVAGYRERASSGGAAETFTLNVDGSRTYERSLSSKDWNTLRFYTVPLVG
jgi:hypothetical protein